jgi:hypothetical protein
MRSPLRPITLAIVVPSYFVGLLACVGLEAEPTVGAKEQAVYNGTACGADILPSAVFVGRVSFYRDASGQEVEKFGSCTGVLIAPDVVLTAAHCVDSRLDNMNLEPVQTVRFVSFNPDARAAIKNKDLILADYYAEHEGFNMNFNPSALGVHNDVALLFLRTPVTNATPAALITAQEASQIQAGGAIAIVGWGSTGLDPQSPSGMRMCAESGIQQVGSHEIVVGGGSFPTMKCHGDSGGPSYMLVNSTTQRKDRVIGITSRGLGADAGNVGCAMATDTNLVQYLGWIDGLMRAACEQNKRAWCQTAGIPHPDYFAAAGQPDPQPQPGTSPQPGASPQPGTNPQTGISPNPGQSPSIAPGTSGGCSLGQNGPAFSASALVFFFLFSWWVRRRLVERASRL